MESEPWNRHHILYPRRLWRADQHTAWLRGQREFIPRIDPDIHEELHHHVPFVAPLDRHTAGLVRSLYVPTLGDPVENLRVFMELIERATEDERIVDIEVANAEVCVMGLSRQLPYLEEGIRE